MRDGDHGLGPLPGGEALQVHLAVLGDHIVGVGTGAGGDGARHQGGTDAGLQLAGLLVLDGGVEADEALAALGEVSAHDEVLLAAGAADVAGAGGLGGDLAEEVHIHGAVDGDEVILGGDVGDVVDVVDGSAHALGVVVQIVIELLGAGGEGVGLTALVVVLALASDAAGQRHVHEGVHVHFGLDAQVLQVGVRDQAAHGGGQHADAQLHAGAVGDLLHHLAGDGPLAVTGLGGDHQLAHGGVGSFHDHVHVVDADAAVKAAVAVGLVGVDLHDDALGLLQHGGLVGGGGTEVEPAVLVHGSDLDHGHVHGRQAVTVVAGDLGEAHGIVVRHALLHHLPLDGGGMPGVVDEVILGVGHVRDGGTAQQDGAPDLHVGELLGTGSQGLVQHVRRAGAPAIVHPVAGADDLDGLLRRGQLLTIHFLKVHDSTPLLHDV